MKHEPVAEGLRWLEQAEADNAGALVLFNAGVHHLACFVSQQVAEKAFTKPAAESALHLAAQVLDVVRRKLRGNSA